MQSHAFDDDRRSWQQQQQQQQQQQASSKINKGSMQWPVCFFMVSQQNQ
jgi:hypothetical protein